MEKYSVLMPVYYRENPVYFRTAIQSMAKQTEKPDEIVIVCDGKLTDGLEEIISGYKAIPTGYKAILKPDETDVNSGRDLKSNGVIPRGNKTSDSKEISFPYRTDVELDDSVLSDIDESIKASSESAYNIPKNEYNQVKNEEEFLYNNISFHIIRLVSNHGIAIALNIGVRACRNDLIARMDSDDISLPDRCAKQLKVFEEDEKLCLLSGAISEFMQEPNDIRSIRSLPQTDQEIRKFAKKRNPMNHMAVMMRKSAVLTVGNYRSIGGAEDYDLWVRMLLKNMQARNLADVLVYARIGNGMQQRRGGCHYAKSAIQLQRIFYREHFINPFEFFRNGLIRLCASLLPSTARTKLYRSALRDKNTK